MAPVYNKDEREVIDQFKTRYMEETSPGGRKDLAQMHIFPSLFNYWLDKGYIFDEHEKLYRCDVCFKYFVGYIGLNANLYIIFIKKLLSWIRNVWRIKKTDTRYETPKYRLTDVLWWTRPEDVFQEIALIMGIESADSHTKGWFELRTTASKQLINKMRDAEKRKLQDEADQMWSMGLPEELKRK